MKLSDLLNIIELTTFVIGLITFKKYKDTYLKYFLFLLGLIVALEYGVLALKKLYGSNFQNHFIYNISTSIQYIYYFTLYYRTLNKVKYKKLVAGFLAFFLISIIFNFSFTQKLNVDGPFHSYTFTLGAVLLIVSIGLFFAEMLKTEKVLRFRSYLMFWISIGLFLFYTAIIPLILSINFLPMSLEPKMLRAILFVLNLMMYGCFSIGFIVSDKQSN
ncbi:MAG: hypothetical protein AAF149_20630 [Bacteroidota bacterium]